MNVVNNTISTIKRAVVGAAEAVLPVTPEQCDDLDQAVARKVECERNIEALNERRTALELGHAHQDDVLTISHQMARVSDLRVRWAARVAALRHAKPTAVVASGPAEDVRLIKAREGLTRAELERDRAESAIVEVRHALEVEEQRQAREGDDDKRLRLANEAILVAESRIRVARKRVEMAQHALKAIEAQVIGERRREAVARLKVTVAKLEASLKAAQLANDAVVRDADTLRGLGVDFGPLAFGPLDSDRFALWTNNAHVTLSGLGERAPDEPA